MQPYEIKGQCVAKRAFEVCAVADLRILLIGPLGSGKSTLRAAFPNVVSAERETCACGHFQDVRQGCTCNARQLIRWYRRIERDARDFDIVLECCPVPAREMMDTRKRDPQDDTWMVARIAAGRKYGESHTSLKLADDAAERTLEMVLRRLSLTYGQHEAVLRTARAIANLDGSEYLKAKHVAEACQYRGDATCFRVDRLPIPSEPLAEVA